jgi:hypothetical protein
MALFLDTLNSLTIEKDVGEVVELDGSVEAITYKFVAPEDGDYIAFTSPDDVGGGIDTQLQAFSEDGAELTEVADDNRDENSGEEVTVSMLSGETVYFVVALYDGAEDGETLLTVTSAGSESGDDPSYEEESENAGYNDGYNDGYSGNPYDDTNSAGYDVASYETGYSNGYSDGQAQAQQNQQQEVKKKVKFFITDSSSIEDIKSSIQSSTASDEVSLVFLKSVGGIAVVDSGSIVDMIGGMTINEIVTSQEFIDAVSDIASVSLTANIVGSDGALVANATVTQTGDKEFEISVPQELVGTDYKIVLSEAV